MQYVYCIMHHAQLKVCIHKNALKTKAYCTCRLLTNLDEVGDAGGPAEHAGLPRQAQADAVHNGGFARPIGADDHVEVGATVEGRVLVLHEVYELEPNDGPWLGELPRGAVEETGAAFCHFYTANISERV